MINCNHPIAAIDIVMIRNCTINDHNAGAVIILNIYLKLTTTEDFLYLKSLTLFLMVRLILSMSILTNIPSFLSDQKFNANVLHGSEFHGYMDCKKQLLTEHARVQEFLVETILYQLTRYIPA